MFNQVTVENWRSDASSVNKVRGKYFFFIVSREFIKIVKSWRNFKHPRIMKPRKVRKLPFKNMKTFPTSENFQGKSKFYVSFLFHQNKKRLANVKGLNHETKFFTSLLVQCKTEKLVVEWVLYIFTPKSVSMTGWAE